ncbi:hypothetical protein [Collinsella ihumii]|uniref:Uncharacterized protein n=1 Tax=Collinsella ihumii TaxID=1720204 RepID=A0ABT7XHN2_9ACTN|nr:hypothetical protein [Collinsella ihumii]MDN0064904.1 hypothetical protein [Collinsella ihumii]
MAFGLITGDEAAAHLSDRTFSESCVGCELDGRYANLNFRHLKLLASLEPLTLDVERFARANLVSEVAERPDADVRPVFSGHLVALNHIQRSPRRVLRRARRVVRLARWHSPMGLPRTRRFISTHLFRAERRGDRGMRGECFQLRRQRASRSASARPSIAISGLARADTAIDANANVMRALADAGIPRRVGSANMRGTRLQQIAVPLYLPPRIVPEGASGGRAKAGIVKLETGMRAVPDALPDNEATRSPFAILMAQFGTWS